MSNSKIIVSAYKDEFLHLNGSLDMRISHTDIARGIVSIGKSHWLQHLKNPRRTFFDFAHYWTGLRNCIAVNPTLRLDPSFERLDGSEKGVKSYQFGMGIAKIVTERILKVPYLLHVDALIKNGAATLTIGTNERGDLIGMDMAGNWHVIEAKGRTYPANAALREKAKRQAERIVDINGIPPKTKSYCISYLSKTSNLIELVDPDDLPTVSTTMNINDDLFVKIYYDRLFSSLYTAAPDAALSFQEYGLQFNLFEIPDTDLYIGLPNNYLKELANGSVGFRNELLERNELFERFSKLNLDSLSIGTDGVLIAEKNLIGVSNSKNRLANPLQIETADGSTKISGEVKFIDFEL